MSNIKWVYVSTCTSHILRCSSAISAQIFAAIGIKRVIFRLPIKEIFVELV